MKTAIQHIQARRIWDSRGRPTVEVDVYLQDGSTGRGVAPAGASRGSREALELRDGGPLLGGLDVSQAVANVNSEIAQALHGLDALDQAGADKVLIDCYFIGDSAGCCGVASPAFVALPVQRASGESASAANTNFRRRRACGQTCGHTGFSGHALRCAVF